MELGPPANSALVPSPSSAGLAGDPQLSGLPFGGAGHWTAAPTRCKNIQPCALTTDLPSSPTSTTTLLLCCVPIL